MADGIPTAGLWERREISAVPNPGHILVPDKVFSAGLNRWQLARSRVAVTCCPFRDDRAFL
jgi:hypothetical protein